MAQQKTRAAVPRGRTTPAPERRVPMTRIRIDDLPVAENLTPEQEALIQGAGLKSFRPSLESLEARDMPSTTPLPLPRGMSVSNNVLYINPDNPASNFSPRVINFNQNVTVEMTPNGQLQLRRGAD